MRHIYKTEKLEIRAVIKCLCKKGMSPKEIHEYLVESYGRVKQWTAEFKRGGWGRALMDGLVVQKMTPLMKMSRSCTPRLCVIGGETCEA